MCSFTVLYSLATTTTTTSTTKKQQSPQHFIHADIADRVVECTFTRTEPQHKRSSLRS